MEVARSTSFVTEIGRASYCRGEVRSVDIVIGALPQCPSAPSVSSLARLLPMRRHSGVQILTSNCPLAIARTTCACVNP
jgi:hypothetical protein